MSDPPLPSSSSLSSRKKSRVSGTNVSKKLLMELQAVIAFACYDSPSLTGAGVSMTEATMEQLMTKLCFGNGNHDDDTICYVDQFLYGVNRFQGLFVSSSGVSPPSAALVDTPAGTSSVDATTMELSIPPMLHRQGKIHIFVGKGSIEKALLCKKAPANDTPISGRTLLRLAKEVLCNCKKVQALVTANNSPYKDGESGPSGSNWEDYIQWCLQAMYKAESNEIGRSKNATSTNVEEEKNEDTTDEVVVVDDTYVFRGFLAWCLWGWIPIPTGAKIKSSLFSDCKVNASYGRKTLSRQALRSVQHADTKAVVSTTAKTTARLSHVGSDAKHEEPTAHIDESTNMLKMALEVLKADFAEKELQKRSYLEALIVRDKLAAVTRKSNRLTEKYNRAKKGTAANEMKVLLDTNDAEIEGLEQQLQDIQQAEMKRRRQLAQQVQAPQSPSTNKDEAGTVCPTIEFEDIDLVSRLPAATTPSTAAAREAQRSEQSKFCIECNVTPSTHNCRKCKEVVCDLCCSSKRNLEMVWWCGS